MHALSALAADVMPAAPPAAASSTATGQEGLFSSRLQTAADMQTAATRPAEASSKHSVNAPAGMPPIVSEDCKDSTEQKNMPAPETSLNGSAGAVLQQAASAPLSELIAAETGSSASISSAQGSESAVSRMLNLLTTTGTADSVLNETKGGQPAGPGGATNVLFLANSVPQATTSTSPAHSTNAALQEEGAQQSGPLIVQNTYGQVIAIYQAGEAEEEAVIASSPGKTNPSTTESQRLDVNSNYIHSHLPNEASPKTAEEGGDRQQDSPPPFRQQEIVHPTEPTKDGQVPTEQSTAQKGQPNIGPENQPLIFAHQRSSAQVTVTGSTVEPSMFRLSSGLTVPEGTVVDQMITHFSVSKYHETGTVNLKLHPQELGELRMEIKIEQDNVKAHIIAQNPQAQEMIDRHLPRLREALEQQGLNLEHIEVTLAANDHAGGERFQESSAWRQPDSFLRRTLSDQSVFTLENDEHAGEDHAIANTLSVLA